MNAAARATAVLGIATGGEGALALLDPEGVLLRLADMPSRLVRLEGSLCPRIATATLAALLAEWAPGRAVVEALEHHPGGARLGEKLRAWGQVDGVLAALGIPCAFAPAALWRRAMQVEPRGASYEQRREACRFAAFRAWPPHAAAFGHPERGPGRAEAALIAAWAAGPRAARGLRATWAEPRIEAAAGRRREATDAR
jgi:hypothetical protein